MLVPALPYRIPRSAAPLLGEKAFRATGPEQFPSSPSPLPDPVTPLSPSSSFLSPRLSTPLPARLPTTKKTRSVFRRNAFSFAAFAPSPGKA